MNARIIYAGLAAAIFLIEVLIALFVRDDFVRPYLGDVLAVVLVYCGLRAMLPIGMWTALAATLAIAVGIELGQLLGLLDLLGWRSNRVASVVLGGSFDPLDILAYVAGCGIVWGVEVLLMRGR